MESVRIVGQWVMKVRVGLFVAFLAMSGQGLSAPTAQELWAEAMNNVSHEYVYCGLYFAITWGALVNDGSDELAATYKYLQEEAYKIALYTAQVGRDDPKLAEEVTMARTEISLKELKTSMGADYSNISIIQNKYGDKCKSMMENPSEHAEGWVDKTWKKYGVERPRQ